MYADTSLRIHVIEATGIPKSGSMFGSSNVYVSAKLDGNKVEKSSSVDPTPTARFDFHVNISCPPGSRQLVLEVKRGGMMGATSIGGCSLNVADISIMEDSWLPLYSYDSRPVEVGKLRVSIQKMGGMAPPAPAPAPAMMGGLVNRAGTANFSEPAPAVSTMGSWGAGADPPSQSRANFTMGAPAGGLTNYAGDDAPDRQPTGALRSQGTRQSFPASAAGGLVNHAEGGANPDMPSGSSMRPVGERPSLMRQGTAGLQNMAAERSDGKRVNALPRVQELLEALGVFCPADSDQRVQLSQALEELRHVPEADLKSKVGQSAYKSCAELISGVFEYAMAKQEKKEMDGALWMAGRLPMLDDDAGVTLQDELRQRWDKVQMEEALARAKRSLSAAPQNADALEALMDALDLAEFHANFAGVDASSEVSRILAEFRPRIQSSIEGLVRARNVDLAETLLGILGVARVEMLGLKDLQQQLQRFSALDLLRSALQPLPGQVGFPSLKDRQLRHATSVCRAAMDEDPSRGTSAAVRDLLLKEMLVTCMSHGNESSLAAFRAAFQLQLPAAEVWAAAHGPYDRLPADRKHRLTSELQRRCKAEWGQEPPSWLLSRELVACQQAIRAALRGGNPNELQAACQQVMETSGGREVCQQDMRLAVNRLKEMYKLPEGWNVESMLAGGSAGDPALLHKVELPPEAVRLFDRLLKETAMPAVRTRDRRGAVPKSFTAVRAIEVRNAANWATYTQRRDEIANECRRLRARHDEAYWRDNLNGTVLTADTCGKVANITTQPPLMQEANEVWMIHGTTHAAADGISSTDFDMARAAPMGLFGAGIYFAESISKSDEYVQGQTVRGVETFPLLICRVCLGYVYYCDERGPDRRRLESRCLREDYHSVLGDRKKTSGTFREFIVYDNLQAFPAYIVYYTRQF